jgi:cytochrome c556
MNRSRSAVIALLLSVAVNAAVGSAARADDAAETYRAAFAKLPDDKASSDAMDDWSKPISPADAAMVEKCSATFDAMHAASTEKFTGWHRDLSAGLATPIPELTKTRQLSVAAAVKIRILCDAKKYDEATALMVDTVTMGRRIATDKTVISRLIGLGIERVATLAVAASVPSMPADAVGKIATAYAAIPPAGPVADAVDGEREMVDIALKKPDKNDPLHGIAPADEAGRTALTKETDKLYTKLAEIVALPPDKTEAAMKEYDQLAAGMSGAVKKIIPKPGVLVAVLQKAAERESLFVAGLYVAADGPDALKSHLDPLTHQPFEYKPVDGGFELRSSQKIGGKDVTIEFGPSALK